MKTVPLTKNRFAVVDDIDYEWAMQWKWYCSFHGYAKRRNAGKIIVMHREIADRAGMEIKFRVDHKNTDSLDNRRDNLRPCTQSQNMANRGAPKHNTSGVKGVHWDKQTGRWMAQIVVNRKIKFLGRFESITEAGEAYMLAADEAWGEFAHA